MFQRILVPLDGSARAERAIPVAARIAKSTDGSIVLTQVVTTPIDLGYYSMEPSLRSMDRVIENDIARAKEYLTGIAQSRDLAGIETQIDVYPGEPALTIFAVSRAQHADLIVMCSRGETGFQRWLLGSVTQKVARHSAIPVLVLREDTDFSPQREHSLRILVPLDGSPLAETALAPAATLGTALSAPVAGELHLMQVLPHPALQDERQNETTRAERMHVVSEAEAYLKTVEQQLRTGVGEHIKNLNVTTTSSVVSDTDIASTLIRVAENGEETGEGKGLKACDMISMATHGHGGLVRWIMGSITERVLGATKLPLLIVQPHKGEVHQEEMKATEMQNWVGLL